MLTCQQQLSMTGNQPLSPKWSEKIECYRRHCGTRLIETCTDSWVALEKERLTEESSQDWNGREKIKVPKVYKQCSPKLQQVSPLEQSWRVLHRCNQCNVPDLKMVRSPQMPPILKSQFDQCVFGKQKKSHKIFAKTLCRHTWSTKRDMTKNTNSSKKREYY